MENINKIDSNLIQVERSPNYLENGTVLTITFNTKNHPYNPRLLRGKSQFLSYEDAEGEEDKQTEEDMHPPINEWEDKEYIFDLIVPKKFPFVFPELRARCDFCKPSLMDERDLMEDMLGKQWHPFIILKEIIEKVPQYFYKLQMREKEGTLYYDWISNYSINSYYDLLKFQDNSEVWKPFVCNLADGEELTVVKKKKKTEEIKRLREDAKQNIEGIKIDPDCIEKVDDEKYQKYIIIVSDNSLLLFERPPYEVKKEEDDTHLEIEPADLKFTTGKLILWGTITSIEQLKRNMEFKNKISIVWTKPVQNEDEFEFGKEDDNDLADDAKEEDDFNDKIYETTIEVPNSDDFMMVVLDKMNEIKENTTQLKKKHILSVEVTMDSVKHKNIIPVLHRIAVFEKEFETKKSKEFAGDLMELYRKAIEHFSALDDDQYKIFVEKNHLLWEQMQQME